MVSFTDQYGGQSVAEDTESVIDWSGAATAAAAMDSTHLTALGSLLNQQVGSASDYSVFAGQNVSATDVLIKYTYYGDADLSGSIDGNDYALLDAGYYSVCVPPTPCLLSNRGLRSYGGCASW